MASDIQVVLPIDDNMVNGRTYTFTFQLQNWILKPSDATLLQDIDAFMPDFITSVQITHTADVSFSLDRGYINITFTYEGDGSDIISDTQAQFIAAFKGGSNDNYSYVQATQGNVGVTVSQQISSAGSTLSQAGKELGAAVGGTAGQITSGTLGGVTSGLGAWLIPVMLVLAAIVLFQLGGLGGIRRAATGQ